MTIDTNEPQAGAGIPAPPAATAPRSRGRRVDLATLRWLGGRLLTGLVAVWAVMTAVFLVTRSVSNPARRMLPIGSSQEQVDALNARLGLDDPLIQQYGHFLSDLLRLDLGNSIWEHRPALQMALERLPLTFTLIGLALVFSVVLFVPLGIYASMRPNSIHDRMVTAASLGGLSVPEFWLGSMLVLVFAVKLGWFPTSGSQSLIYGILPALTLAFSMGGRLAQVTRTSFLDQARMPYVQTARAKGFSETYILRKHMLRNAVLPIVSLASWDFARILTGAAVVVEVVFAWPGFGRLIIESVQRQDFPAIQACVFVGAVAIVVINIATDIVARIIDPRVVNS